jgi:uncharacterized protein
MDLKHSFTVPASIDETWAAFQDIESVAECFPGAQITDADEDTFTGTVKVKLGPIALVYKGTGTFTERDVVTHKMVIDAKGKDKRGNGTAGAMVTATMTEVADGTTVDVVTDLAITGKPAQFGRGVIQDVSDKLLGQFVDCLQAKVGSGGSPAEAQPALAAVPAQSPAEPSAESTPASTPSSAASPSSASSERKVGQIPQPVAADSPDRAQQPSTSSSKDEALDLGATMLPVLAKAYWKQLVGGLAGLAIVGAVIRRLRHR